MAQQALQGLTIAILATDGFDQSELLGPREAGGSKFAGAVTEGFPILEDFTRRAIIRRCGACAGALAAAYGWRRVAQAQSADSRCRTWRIRVRLSVRCHRSGYLNSSTAFCSVTHTPQPIGIHTASQAAVTSPLWPPALAAEVAVGDSPAADLGAVRASSSGDM